MGEATGIIKTVMVFVASVLKAVVVAAVAAATAAAAAAAVVVVVAEGIHTVVYSPHKVLRSAPPVDPARRQTVVCITNAQSCGSAFGCAMLVLKVPTSSKSRSTHPPAKHTNMCLCIALAHLYLYL